jgi:hypothetical protein
VYKYKNVILGGLAIWHFWKMPEEPVLKWASRVLVKRMRII